MAAGDLDASFAGNGKKRIGFGGTDVARAVLAQTNGRLVVAGGGTASTAFCVARLRSNAACTARSDSLSSALVASSKIRIGAFFKMARAMATR